MRWSWKLGRLAGIDVYVHSTFLLLVGWVAISHFLARRSLWDAWAGVVFILALFGIVVLHELGHALMARRFGVRTRDITLLPIGGVARLEHMPEEPRQELLVAFAGPAVNIALAALLYVVLQATAGLAPVEDTKLVGGDFLSKMLWINVLLAAFNLIPAFPMDGGRVLRAWLAMRMDYVQATQVAANVGQGVALLFGFFGLFSNPLLVFIALFVWLGASGEASMVQMRSALGGIPVSRAMITDFRCLTPDETLQQAMEHIIAGFQHDFPVVSDGRLVGVLTRGDLMKAVAARGPLAPVSEAMKPQFETAEPSEMLEGAFRRLQGCECHSLPVLRGGQLVGILTMENIGEFLMIQSALKGVAHRTPLSLAG